MIATALAVAFVVYSCKGGDDAPGLPENTPMQVVDNMFVVQTENGVLKMRMEADRMERYSTDTTSYELFPKGFATFMYQEDGKLETTIFSDEAIHIKNTESREEIWKAYGNVRVRNEMKNETMETDTLYWDRDKEKIYTDCYVKLYSKDGMVQGYGMISDQRASNSIIKKPFDGYGVVIQDTTEVVLDTANFIGPLKK